MYGTKKKMRGFDNDLISANIRIWNGEIVTDSRNVAAAFNKQHHHLLATIDNIKKKDIPGFPQMFFVSTAPDSYGRQQRIYYMNSAGFAMLTIGFTGKKACQLKAEYIKAFEDYTAAERSN